MFFDLGGRSIQNGLHRSQVDATRKRAQARPEPTEEGVERFLRTDPHPRAELKRRQVVDPLLERLSPASVAR